MLYQSIRGKHSVNWVQNLNVIKKRLSSKAQALMFGLKENVISEQVLVKLNANTSTFNARSMNWWKKLRYCQRDPELSLNQPSLVSMIATEFLLAIIGGMHGSAIKMKSQAHPATLSELGITIVQIYYIKNVNIPWCYQTIFW